MSPMGVHVRWQGRATWVLLALTISTCTSAPQHNNHPHFRITISAEDTGPDTREVSDESLISSGHNSNLRSGQAMTHSWMNFGNSDASQVGKPMFTVRRDSQESRESGFNGHTNFYSGDIDDDFDHDDLFSNEFDDDDDDLAIMARSLGRRYHPAGVPLPQKPLFIPETQPVVTAPGVAKTATQPAIQPHAISPYMMQLDDSEEEFDHTFENHIDDLNDSSEDFYPSLRRMHTDDSEEVRITLDENTLKSRYNFVDSQGSVNWGYNLQDQFQNQVVHRDGSMEGEYGWDTPDGSKIHIKYTAGKNGFRVVSSFGLDTESHEIDDDTYIPGTGVPLPGSPNLHSGSGSNIGVPMPTPGAGFNSVDGGSIGAPVPNPGAGFNSADGGSIGVPMPGFDGQDIGVAMPIPDSGFAAGGDFGGQPTPGFDGNFNEQPLPGFDENFNEQPLPGFGGADIGVPIPPPTPDSGFAAGGDFGGQNIGIPMPGLDTAVPNFGTSDFQPTPTGPGVGGSGFQVIPDDDDVLPVNLGGNGQGVGVGLPPINNNAGGGIDFNSAGNLDNVPFESNLPALSGDFGGPSDFSAIPENMDFDAQQGNSFGGVGLNDLSGIPGDFSGIGGQTDLTAVPEDSFAGISGPTDLTAGNAFSGIGVQTDLTAVPDESPDFDNILFNPSVDTNLAGAAIDNVFGVTEDGAVNDLLTGPSPADNAAAFPIV